jgi:hypothetical protein
LGVAQGQIRITFGLRPGKSKRHKALQINVQGIGRLWIQAGRIKENLTRLSKRLSVNFPRLLWCLRREQGQIGGRAHFHCLMTGLDEP